MRGLLTLTCAAFMAAAVFALPKSASALPAAASALVHGQTDAGLVQDVRKRWYKRRYYRPYRYRPYRYRRYGYYRPYWPYYSRPYYRGWGWGYPYYRRPGVSIWLGF